MACIRGWVGSRRWVKATIETQTAVVCPVSHTNSHNPQDRLRQSLATVWHHTSLLMLFSGSTGPVVHVHGLTGSRKALCESKLGLKCIELHMDFNLPKYYLRPLFTKVFSTNVLYCTVLSLIHACTLHYYVRMYTFMFI